MKLSAELLAALSECWPSRAAALPNKRAEDVASEFSAGFQSQLSEFRLPVGTTCDARPRQSLVQSNAQHAWRSICSSYSFHRLRWERAQVYWRRNGIVTAQPAVLSLLSQCVYNRQEVRRLLSGANHACFLACPSSLQRVP